MSQSKASVFLSLMFVFLSGALVGTLGYRYYSINTAPVDKGGPGQRGPRDPAEVKKHIVAEMTDYLKLDPQQVAQLSTILDETRDKFDVVHKEMNGKAHQIWDGQIEQINAILRPEQRPLYQQLRDKHEKEREERNKKRMRGIQQDTGKK